MALLCSENCQSIEKLDRNLKNIGFQNPFSVPANFTTMRESDRDSNGSFVLVRQSSRGLLVLVRQAFRCFSPPIAFRGDG